ncbi:hypothetical protein [Nonomuraea recticatena]|uniref:hypothetical protein n=1 Tax=Nonomuraea recticatena TaxID=46178 RepID=UPI00362152A8
MPHPGMRRRVAAIPGTPLPNGLLGGCTTVIDVEDEHELLGVDWVSLSCKHAYPTDWCPTDDAGTPLPPPGPKQFERPDSESAGPVTVYAGAICSAPGFPYAEAEQHARAGLSQGRGGRSRNGSGRTCWPRPPWTAPRPPARCRCRRACRSWRGGWPPTTAA